jgi:hypothetical protein
MLSIALESICELLIPVWFISGPLSWVESCNFEAATLPA